MNLVLSTSSISDYLACPKRYLLSSIYRLPRQPSLRQALGTAVHAGIADWLVRKKTEPDAALTARRVMLETFDDEAAEIDEDGVTEARDDSNLMFDAYRKAMVGFRPRHVEKPFLFRMHGVFVSGVLDAADDDVHDTKTTAGKTIDGHRPRFDPGDHDLQLGIYGLGYQALEGKRPRRYFLDVVTRLGRFRQYERQPSISAAVDAIGIARDGIMREEFPPSGALSGICGWCPMQNVCPDARV